MFNDYYPHLALDNDTLTCAQTGWETIGPWWKFDLGSRKTVTGVNITGQPLYVCTSVVKIFARMHLFIFRFGERAAKR